MSIGGSYSEIEFSKKIKELVEELYTKNTKKGEFCTPHTIYVNINFDKAVFYGNIAFLILVLSSKKKFTSFLKNGLVFQKTYFKVKVMKRSKHLVIFT